MPECEQLSAELFTPEKMTVLSLYAASSRKAATSCLRAAPCASSDAAFTDEQVGPLAVVDDQGAVLLQRGPTPMRPRCGRFALRLVAAMRSALLPLREARDFTTNLASLSTTVIEDQENWRRPRWSVTSSTFRSVHAIFFRETSWFA